MTRYEQELGGILGYDVKLAPPGKEEEVAARFLLMELACALVDGHPMQSRIDGFVSLLQKMGRHEEAISLCVAASQCG